MALKFLQLLTSNMNTVVMLMRWVHISLHRTEMEGRVALQFAIFEREGFPLSETLKITKTIIQWKQKKITDTKWIGT